ncbi:hypothetical protein LTSEWAN_2279, partial [Salmonella enterica subsp. enterica serovar Wandsworth str. A4-580]
MRRVGKHAFSATFFQCFCCFAQSTAGIDHIINQHAVTASDVADDIYSSWAT